MLGNLLAFSPNKREKGTSASTPMATGNEVARKGLIAVTAAEGKRSGSPRTQPWQKEESTH